MLAHLMAMLQAQVAVQEPEGWWYSLKEFVDTPAPYSPFSEYLLVLFILWLIARLEHSREERRKTFGKQAQEVLEDKYESGELSRSAYEKYRQDVSMRPRR